MFTTRTHPSRTDDIMAPPPPKLHALTLPTPTMAVAGGRCRVGVVEAAERDVSFHFWKSI